MYIHDYTMSRVRLTYKHTDDLENPITGFLTSDHVILSCVGKTEDEVFKKLCKKQYYYYKELPKIRDFILEKRGLLTDLSKQQ